MITRLLILLARAGLFDRTKVASRLINDILAVEEDLVRAHLAFDDVEFSEHTEGYIGHMQRYIDQLVAREQALRTTLSSL